MVQMNSQTGFKFVVIIFLINQLLSIFYLFFVFSPSGGGGGSNHWQTKEGKIDVPLSELGFFPLCDGGQRDFSCYSVGSFFVEKTLTQSGL